MDKIQEILDDIDDNREEIALVKCATLTPLEVFETMKRLSFRDAQIKEIQMYTEFVKKTKEK